jgi:hypothetical protein
MPCGRTNGIRGRPEPLVDLLLYGGTAVNTGYYTFEYVKDGETKTLPARYSFTFVQDGESWMIVDHHSSPMPTPPR